MLFSLVQQWSKYHESNLLKIYGLDLKGSDGYQLDVAPLIYACLMHKRVPIQKWNVLVSDEFKSSEFIDSPDWVNLKNLLEDGGDITPFLSKRVNDWETIDYLLYTFKIHHIHLARTTKGGKGDKLVFGVFDDGKFYALGIGNHSDLYKVKKWVEILVGNWSGFREILSNVEEIINVERIFDEVEFKRIANNTKLQVNMLTPMQFHTPDGESVQINNPQHTTVINYTLNEITYKKIPFQVYCAYSNEASHLEKIETNLLERYGAASHLHLTINLKKKHYKIVVNHNPYLMEIVKFKDHEAIVTTFHEKKYFPYVN